MGLQLPKFQLPKLSLPSFRKPAAPRAQTTPGAPPFQLPILKIILVAVPVAAAVGAGFVITSLGQQAQQLKAELMQSQHTVEDLSAKNEQVVSQLQDVMKERDAVGAQVESLRQQLDASSIDLEAARGELQVLRGRFDRLSDARKSLESRVAELTKERAAQENEVTHLQQEKAEGERSLARVRERLNFIDRDYQQMVLKMADLERQRSQPQYGVVSVPGPLEPLVPAAEPPSLVPQQQSLGPTVELPPIIVRKDQAGTSSAVRGRLVEVNGPHQFIVVDKGSIDGVRVGMAFDIVRGAGTVIGRATVVRVRPQLSACDIVKKQTTEPLQVGDVAVQSAQ